MGNKNIVKEKSEISNGSLPQQPNLKTRPTTRPPLTTCDWTMRHAINGKLNSHWPDVLTVVRSAWRRMGGDCDGREVSV